MSDRSPGGTPYATLPTYPLVYQVLRSLLMMAHGSVAGPGLWDPKFSRLDPEKKLQKKLPRKNLGRAWVWVLVKKNTK